MHDSVLDFLRRSLSPIEVYGKSVLEVGAFDVNGSPRPVIEAMEPARYVGIDLSDGPGVDWIVDIEKPLTLPNILYGWDIVVCCEMLEHVEDWRAAVRNLNRLVDTPGGILLVTTRSKGFPYHPFPIDTWRYEMADMESIFVDFKIEMLESDDEAAGVFMKAIRLDVPFVAALEAIDLYRMPVP
jgi:SAM-dependent methyltransferase